MGSSVAEAIRVELDADERRLLADLVESAHREKLREIHHTATADYKQILRGQIEILERLGPRLRS